MYFKSIYVLGFYLPKSRKDKITPMSPLARGIAYNARDTMQASISQKLVKKKLLYHLTSRSRFTTKAALDTVKIFNDQNIAKITMLHYSVNEIDFGKTRKQLRKFY